MGRSESTLRPPDPALDLARFPLREHRGGQRLHRAHLKSLNPWWFSSSQGRFDLAAPRGTLNLASSRETAVRESLGGVLATAAAIPATVVAGRLVSSLEIPRSGFADFAADSASAFGIVPGDVSAPRADYGLTQTWATAIAAAGFDGIRSRSRFGSGCCLYVFGAAGEHPLGPVLATTTMRAVLAEMPGVTIEPTPASGSLIIDP